MNKSIKASASSVRLFTELRNAVSNPASILVGDANARYRALAGLMLSK
jgi:hypothetical protein